MLKVIPLLEPYNLALPMSYNVDRGLLGNVTEGARHGWAAAKTPPRCHPRHLDSLLAGCSLALSHCCSFLGQRLSSWLCSLLSSCLPLSFLLLLSFSLLHLLLLHYLYGIANLLSLALSFRSSLFISFLLLFFFGYLSHNSTDRAEIPAGWDIGIRPRSGGRSQASA